MRQKIQGQLRVHRMSEVSSLAETSAIHLRQSRSEQASALRMASSPASQGHSAALAPVATAAPFSSVCNGVPATDWLPAMVVSLRQDNPRGGAARKRLGSDRDPLWFPRRIRGTRFSNRFFICRPSRGKVAVAGPVPAAAAFCAPADKLGRTNIVGTIPQGGAR